MKQKFISFIHQPKKVAIVSLGIALALGAWGYHEIHKAPQYRFVKAETGTILGDGNSFEQNTSLGFLAGGRIRSVSVKAGDVVHKGDVLAVLDAENVAGTLTQAKAAYAVAQANYQKVMNGATGTAIDVARASVRTAETSLQESIKQQNVLVENARRALLNSSLVAESVNDDMTKNSPIITGTYIGDTEGTITLNLYQSGDGGYFSFSGIASGTGKASTTTPQAMGSTGLSVRFPATGSMTGSWVIAIPNTSAPNYLLNYNNYQNAIQTKDQVIKTAQAVLDQANASLSAVIASARPEDIASAKAQVENAYGALQIAQAAYDNTVIVAPGDGTITAVSIAPGQIAVPNVSAMEFSGIVSSKNVLVLVPKNAVIHRDGAYVVLKKVGKKTIEQQITVGISDDKNVEVLSGLSTGDEVVVR